MKKIGLVLLIGLSIFTAKAQERKLHFSSWNTIDIHKKLTQNWSVNAEFNFRRTNFLTDWEQFIIRPFVHYTFGNDLDVAIGYSYIKNYSYADFSAPIDAVENNIFQQLTIKHAFSKFSFAHRLRFEERFQQKIVKTENDSYSIDGIRYRNRFRYKFQIAIPLYKFNTNRVLSLVAYDEAHLDFGNRLRPEKLDQNWMFLGVSFRVNNHIKIRTGYHDIYAKRTDFFINNQIWETTLTYKM
ncbi:uncharacterized protein DUF2490 [Kordia periserrulae]|uniref:Uncharacterized protein DUF2490 n=1 Tax=Kordia periserrulae TaxID=701523 RepID=A0A2T6BUL8_9FLAO|nr:DUF2490 domain-containing protein [Kordia periserrulae]PTX59763.1 uncharacterized protein DUF2490 [Kordia periserrulae]